MPRSAWASGAEASTTDLSDDALRHVQRLVASWQLLADLCFSDLLVLGASRGAGGHDLVVLGHVRPTTGQTLYLSDLIGTVVTPAERPVVSRAWHQGDIVGGDTTMLGGSDRVRVQCIPVRHDGEVIAVMTRESAMTSGRRPGELERQYLDVFERLAHMVAEGSYPFPHDEVELEEAPRVADGLIVLDESAQVRFASPNAISALHRMGLPAYSPGTLGEVGIDQTAAEDAIRLRVPVTEEVERGDAALLLKAVPLIGDGRVNGVFVLTRDVTDLRCRDRMLMSKNAMIGEIHHRVKNNLQTIAALLRLQRRRLGSEEARDAIAESERRIRSIAIVHESLSRNVGDIVSFSDIVVPLVRIVEETVSTDDLRLHFDVEGDVGELPGELATPLAVVLNELMQNAVDHAFPFEGDVRQEGNVRVTLSRTDDALLVDVMDDGVGLRPGFSLETSSGLGLSIVQTLVTTELGGSIEMHNDHGTRVSLRVPIKR